jgi:hypothetical protein
MEKIYIDIKKYNCEVIGRLDERIIIKPKNIDYISLYDENHMEYTNYLINIYLKSGKNTIILYFQTEEERGKCYNSIHECY